MSKKNKPVEVELIETNQHKDGNIDLEVKVKKKTIGSLKQGEGDRSIKVTLASGKEINVGSVNEGIQSIVAEYNLHDL